MVQPFRKQMSVYLQACVCVQKHLLITIHCSQFRLSYYPHRKDAFTKLLKSVFGENAQHALYGDFRPLADVQDPAFFIHVIEK